MKLLPSIVIVAVAVVVGLLVGRSTSESRPPAKTTTATGGNTYIAKHYRKGGIDRAALRQELRAVLAERSPTSTSSGAADNGGDPDDPGARVERIETGQRLIDDAVSRGTWADTERAALRRLLPSLHHTEATRILVRLSAAINRGDVVPDGDVLMPRPTGRTDSHQP